MNHLNLPIYLENNINFLGCEGMADICFIIDKSGSIRHEKFPEVQAFINGIISQLEVYLSFF